MNKYIQYTLLCIGLFTLFIIAAMFILGNTEVFSWDSGVRLSITALTGGILAIVIVKNNWKRPR